jgi:hypothetical protein
MAISTLQDFIVNFVFHRRVGYRKEKAGEPYEVLRYSR